MSQDLLALAAELERQAHQLEHPDFRRELEEIKRGQAEDVAASFEGSHDPDGEPWPEPKAPLREPRHIIGRRLAGAGGLTRRLLLRTRALYISATESVIQTNVGQTSFVVEPAWLDYGEAHMDGGGNLPQREFSGFSRARLDDAEKRVLDRMAQIIEVTR